MPVNSPGPTSTAMAPNSAMAVCTSTAALSIDRYRLPNIRSLNFVIHDLLQEGVAAGFHRGGERGAGADFCVLVHTMRPENLFAGR